jgi:urate oxidase
MADGKIVLGANQYGKAEVRLVKVTRDKARHEIDDLNITSQLRGDFDAAHVDGDNAHVIATDTQKNTVFAFAREGVGAPEELLLRLGRHFVGDFAWVSGGRWTADKYSWSHIDMNDGEHDHAFVRGGTETRTATVTFDGDTPTVIAGLKDLAVLKSTGSEFVGFPRDRYTTLQDATDRVLATSVTSKWRYNTLELDYDEVYADVRRILLRAFAEKHSHALQQTLFQMGKAVLEAHPEIDEIKFSMPNLHHFLVDLTPFQLDNPGEVFYASDRPYGLIEAAVQRDDASDPGRAWEGIAGFC